MMDGLRDHKRLRSAPWPWTPGEELTDVAAIAPLLLLGQESHHLSELPCGLHCAGEKGLRVCT